MLALGLGASHYFNRGNSGGSPPVGDYVVITGSYTQSGDYRFYVLNG